MKCVHVRSKDRYYLLDFDVNKIESAWRDSRQLGWDGAEAAAAAEATRWSRCGEDAVTSPLDIVMPPGRILNVS